MLRFRLSKNHLRVLLSLNHPVWSASSQFRGAEEEKIGFRKADVQPAHTTTLTRTSRTHRFSVEAKARTESSLPTDKIPPCPRYRVWSSLMFNPSVFQRCTFQNQPGTSCDCRNYSSPGLKSYIMWLSYFFWTCVWWWVPFWQWTHRKFKTNLFLSESYNINIIRGYHQRIVALWN